MSKKSRANKAAAQQEAEVVVTEEQPVIDESAITGEPPAEDLQADLQSQPTPAQEEPKVEDTGEAKAAEIEEPTVSTAPPPKEKKNELEKRIARLEKSVGKIEAIAKRLAAAV